MDLLTRFEEFMSQKNECRILQLDQEGFIEKCRQQFWDEISNILISWNSLNRLLIVSDRFKRGIFYVLNGSVGEYPFLKEKWTEISFKTPHLHISYWNLPDELVRNLTYPHTHLIALYVKENFPLPRFALGIADIASRIRERHIGQVSMSDMQLNLSSDEIVNKIRYDKPNLIWISVTFWQQGLLVEILQSIDTLGLLDSLVVVWGSLAALNYRQILAQFPEVIIWIEYGEDTMVELAKYKRWEKAIEEVPGIAYVWSNRSIIVQKWIKQSGIGIVPELDLLKWILDNQGVMNLESSRGCTFSCSFCPREHKGSWNWEISKELKNFIPLLRDAFDYYDCHSRTIYLVDEAFLGYWNNSLLRAYQITDLFHAHGLKFESSSRIDQVSNPRKWEEWHLERIAFWKHLTNTSLKRMLFWVESWVNTILERFNKKITQEQTIQALRILSSIGVPVRLTYITFDPLMTMEELIESFRFQGRKDILIDTCPDLSDTEILTRVSKIGYAKKEDIMSDPLYRNISYLLVSMECLLGSKYLTLWEEAWLAGELNPEMWKRNVLYKDERIGQLSYHGQLWIDRLFALDYTLKSLQKVQDIVIIKRLRTTIKDSHYSLLSCMLAIANWDSGMIYDEYFQIDRDFVTLLLDAWKKEKLDTVLIELLNNHFLVFRRQFDEILNQWSNCDSENYVEVFTQFQKCIMNSDWRIING